MSMIIDGTNGLTFNNATTQNSGGKILQVVNGISNTNTSTTGNTFIDTGITASITPLFANSKIMIFVSVSAVYKNGSNSSIGLTVLRGSSEIIRFADNGLSYNGTTAANQTSGSINYLDSPATTSATTYKVQMKNGSGSGGSVSINDGNVYSSITLMEIAG